MQMITAYNNFITSRVLADLSKKSVDNYGCFLTPFVKFVGYEKEVEDLTQDEINKYILSVVSRDISKSSKATYVRNTKIFLKYIQGLYNVSFNAKEIRVPKPVKRVVTLYTTQQVQTIFDSITADSDWIVTRNKCIIALMYDSGLRQNEVCTLKRSRIFFDENRMVVRGKGNKERTVPLGALTYRFMVDYINKCPFNSDLLFVNRRGQPLTCNTVKLFVTKLADKLPFDLSSHKLRHNFATNYCLDQYESKGNVDIYKLMYLMGHEDIETTERYLHFAMEVVASKESISHLDKLYGSVI